MIECKGYKAFAEYLIDFFSKNKDGIVEFATVQDYTDDNNDCWFNYSDWFFAKIVHIEEYESRFILIDYGGGENATVIPLSSYARNDMIFDSEDKEFIISLMKDIFHEPLDVGENESVWVDENTSGV